MTARRAAIIVCARCGEARRNKGRGLCQCCYEKAARRGELEDYDRRNRTREELLEEWDLLRSHSLEVVAARIGVTWQALDRALHRAARAGDPRAAHHGCRSLTDRDRAGVAA